MKYLVIYEKSAAGWGAYAPDLPGLGCRWNNVRRPDAGRQGLQRNCGRLVPTIWLRRPSRARWSAFLQLDPKEIEDVILGCAMPEAEQGMNVARIASLRAGLPVEISAMTINRFCSSGLQSIAMAAERIMAAARRPSSPAASSR
jgi:hypothetical protein